MSIKNIENHLTTFDEDNKIKLNELSGNISSISNAIHLLDERLNMLNEVLNETSQKNSDNEIKTVKFKADFNDVKSEYQSALILASYKDSFKYDKTILFYQKEIKENTRDIIF